MLHLPSGYSSPIVRSNFKNTVLLQPYLGPSKSITKDDAMTQVYTCSWTESVHSLKCSSFIMLLDGPWIQRTKRYNFLETGLVYNGSQTVGPGKIVWFGSKPKQSTMLCPGMLHFITVRIYFIVVHFVSPRCTMLRQDFLKRDKKLHLKCYECCFDRPIEAWAHCKVGMLL